MTMTDEVLARALRALREESQGVPAAPTVELRAPRRPSEAWVILPAVLAALGTFLPGADPSWARGLSHGLTGWATALVEVLGALR
jgi:hypothetical protein